MVRCLSLAAFVLLAACNNPCQSMCVEMANYAQECGYDVSSDELQACRDAIAEVTDELAQECITASDPDQLREWWTCDDLHDNYENAAK